jgi:MHS family proline/betaine transporter-like MFS transporter
MCELFPRKVSYTAVSDGYGFTLGLLGGTAPLVATSLIDVTGNQLSPAFYVMLAASIGLLTLLRTPETRDRVLD